MNPLRRKSVVRSLRFSPTLDDLVIELTRKINSDREKTGASALPVSHTYRMLIGHGVHRYSSGCKCSANKK